MAEKQEGEEGEENDRDGEDNQEFSLDIGNDSDMEVENNTGIKINIEDATPQKEVEELRFENRAGTKTEIGATCDTGSSERDDSEAKHLDQLEDGGNSLPYIDEHLNDTNDDEMKSKVPDITLNQQTCNPKYEDKSNIVSKESEQGNSGYKSGMKKFFQNISEAQQGDEADFSVESRYSDEDSEIKNILGSGQRDSRYVIKSDEESPRKSKCRKIPVLDTSESEYYESELLRAEFFNFAFDEKE